MIDGNDCQIDQTTVIAIALIIPVWVTCGHLTRNTFFSLIVFI